MKKGILWLTDPKELPGKISVRLFRTARPSLAVSEKSSSLRSGIFPESLAFPESAAVMPL